MGTRGGFTMMKWVFCGLIILSVIFGTLTGRMGSVSEAAIAEAGNAVTLLLRILGAICFWSGLMKVAEAAGVTAGLAKLLSPVIRLLFRTSRHNKRAMELISMNMTANLLGLGNAATPLGMAAMQELAKEQPAHLQTTASADMATLVVINTASIQLIPTTIALLRLQYGAQNPMDILPAILLCSLCSVTAGVLVCKLLTRKGGGVV